MRVRQRGQRAMAFGESGQRSDHVHDFRRGQSQARTNLYQIGVVGDIRTCRAQMNDALRVRRLQSVRINVRHDVVSNLFFFRFRFIEIDAVGGRFE
jgi:hypothetical protein